MKEEPAQETSAPEPVKEEQPSYDDSNMDGVNGQYQGNGNDSGTNGYGNDHDMNGGNDDYEGGIGMKEDG